MKQRMISAAIYGGTALALWYIFDTLDGLEPPKIPPSALMKHLFQISIAGIILFAVAAIISTFALRFGVGCGAVACILSWPHWSVQIIEFHWERVIPLGVYNEVGRPELLAMFMLIISTAYTLSQLRASVRFRAKGVEGSTETA